MDTTVVQLTCNALHLVQAVSLTLPDAAPRRQLFELSRGVMQVDESRLDALLERTGGVTASFLTELLRRSAVAAAARAPWRRCACPRTTSTRGSRRRRTPAPR